MYTYKTISSKNFIGRIVNDKSPESPREWSNLGTIIAFHNKFNLGDAHTFNKDEYQSWDELKVAILKEYGTDAIILPIYMYVHSDVSLSTNPFGCRWDSGQVGFIVCSRDDARKYFEVKRISKKKMTLIENYLKSEIEVYSQYINGDVYGFEIYSIDGDGDDEEFQGSCYGCFGMDAVVEEVQSLIDGFQHNHDKEHKIQMEFNFTS